MDVDPDGLEREDLLQFLLADFDVHVDIDAFLVELEGRNAFVCETEDARVRAKPETDLVGAEGQTVDFDGDKGGGGGGGAEFGFADLEVVVRFEAEFVWEEGAVVDGVAGLDDEVFEEEVQFRDGDFEARDGYILDGLDEERDEDVEGVFKEFRIGYIVDRGKNGYDLGACFNQFGDVGVFDGGFEGYSNLLEEIIDILADGRFGPDLL